MSKGHVTKVMLAQRVRDLVAGTKEHPPSGQFKIGGETFTAQTLTQTIQSLGDALSTADMAKASWKDALTNLADVHAKVGPLIRTYQSWVVATYGNAPAVLADYGVTPRKAHTPLTAEKNAAAVAKRRATRSARHTLGPKQKRDIKGAAPAGR